MYFCSMELIIEICSIGIFVLAIIIAIQLFFHYRKSLENHAYLLQTLKEETNVLRSAIEKEIEAVHALRISLEESVKF